MTNAVCNFLAEKNDWETFSKNAKKLGVPKAVILRSFIKEFNRNPKIVFGEPEKLEMHSKHQAIANKIMKQF